MKHKKYWKHNKHILCVSCWVKSRGGDGHPVTTVLSRPRRRVVGTADCHPTPSSRGCRGPRHLGLAVTHVVVLFRSDVTWWLRAPRQHRPPEAQTLHHQRCLGFGHTHVVVAFRNDVTGWCRWWETSPTPTFEVRMVTLRCGAPSPFSRSSFACVVFAPSSLFTRDNVLSPVLVLLLSSTWEAPNSHGTHPCVPPFLPN